MATTQQRLHVTAGSSNGTGLGRRQQQHQQQPNLEASQSRPVDSRNKKLGFLQRWIVGRGRASGRTTTISTVTTRSARLSPGRTSTVPSAKKANTATMSMTQNHRKIQDQQQHHHANVNMLYSSPMTSDLMAWLQQECPRDILGHVLSYAGPQTAQVLYRTNTFWYRLIQEEATWRTMCEGLYKVRIVSVVISSSVIEVVDVYDLFTCFVCARNDSLYLSDGNHGRFRLPLLIISYISVEGWR